MVEFVHGTEAIAQPTSRNECCDVFFGTKSYYSVRELGDRESESLQWSSGLAASDLNCDNQIVDHFLVMWLLFKWPNKTTSVCNRH